MSLSPEVSPSTGSLAWTLIKQGQQEPHPQLGRTPGCYNLQLGVAPMCGGRPHSYLLTSASPSSPHQALPSVGLLAGPSHSTASRGCRGSTSRPLGPISHAGPLSGSPFPIQSFKFSWDFPLCAFGSRCVTSAPASVTLDLSTPPGSLHPTPHWPHASDMPFGALTTVSRPGTVSRKLLGPWRWLHSSWHFAGVLHPNSGVGFQHWLPFRKA